MTADVQTLLPGDVACALSGMRLETLRGSCVAIVMTDPRRTVGAMCHIVHCRPAAECQGKPGDSADAAIDILAQDLGGATYRRLAWTVGPGLPEVTVVAVQP